MIPEIQVSNLLLEKDGLAVGVMYPGSNTEGGVPLVRVGDISESGIADNTAYSISNEVHSEYRRTALKGGECLITLVGKPGIVNVVPQDKSGWNVARALAVARLNEPSDALYFKYAMMSASVQHEIRSRLNTTVQPTLNLKDIRELKLPWPDKASRENLVSAIRSFDDKIDLNRRMNETLEDMARALFRDWFVDFGPTRRQIEGATDPAAIMGHAFPYDKAATFAPLFPAALGGEGLPEGWEKRVLHDLTDWVNGAAYKNMHFSAEPDALPVIKIAELKAGVTKNTKHTNTALGEKYRITDGEVLFSWSGNPDTSIDTFIWSGGEGWLNQHIFAVRPNGEVQHSVLYFLLKYLRPQFAEIARDKQTTGLGHVTKQDLRSMRVCLGTDEILGHLTSLLEPFFQKIYANQLENRTHAQMRDILLPKLMSGEIRLRDLEAIS